MAVSRASWLVLCLLSDNVVAMRVTSSSRRGFIVAAAAATQQGKAAAAVEQSPGSLGARVEELKTLGARVEQSGKVEVPEFWAGRLQGKPPPTPKVVLRGDVPPFVILPGTYAQAAILALASAAISAAVVRRRIDRLDLVSVLKARD